MKNAHLEALGNSQNNPRTRWNLAVQLPLANSTIMEGCEISRRIFRPLCEIKSVQNFLCEKTLVRNPPPYMFPPKSPQARPLETPLELGDPNCPSSRKLQTTFPSHNNTSCTTGKAMNGDGRHPQQHTTVFLFHCQLSTN